MIRRRVIAAALGAVLAAVLAGCGGSSRSAMGPAAYRSAADRICRTATAKAAAYARTAPRTAASIGKILAVGAAIVPKLRALTPPPSLRAQVHPWLTALSLSFSDGAKLLDAASARDTVQLTAVSATLKSVSLTAKSDASALGLPSCASSG